MNAAGVLAAIATACVLTACQGEVDRKAPTEPVPAATLRLGTNPALAGTLDVRIGMGGRLLSGSQPIKSSYCEFYAYVAQKAPGPVYVSWSGLGTSQSGYEWPSFFGGTVVAGSMYLYIQDSSGATGEAIVYLYPSPSGRICPI
jgi:hypothetical protein